MKRSIAIILLLISIPAGPSTFQVAGQESEPPRTDANQLLKSLGIRKVKATYTLIAEDEAFQLYRQTLAAMDEAGQAIAMAGDAAARNQSIIDFQQRIAFDAGLRDQMRVEMRDGTSPEEQATRRAAARDLAIAKQQRALLGQADARPNPKQAATLANKAAEACRKAQKTKQTLVDQVYDVAETYRTLGADSQLRKAMGNRRLAPSDRFNKLAAGLGFAKGRVKTPSAEELARRRIEAAEELTQAADRLRRVRFGGDIEERNRRRTATIEAIEEAIGKLNAGEMKRRMVDKAAELNEGYTGGFSPSVRDVLDDTGKRLERAKAILRGQ
jgi:hypothetical protein